MLAHAIAGELQIPFLKISAPEIVSGMSGESEQKIRTLFAQALEQAPCIIFIDEIDAITPKRATAQREMERRMVAQLLTCMDSLSTTQTGESDKVVLVIGATNRPDSLDSALRRAGRFDREIALGIPDESARCKILEVMCRPMRIEGEFDFEAIAKQAVGFVGADLAALTREAAVIAVNRIFRTMLPTPTLRPQENQQAQIPSLTLTEPAVTNGSLTTPSSSSLIRNTIVIDDEKKSDSTSAIDLTEDGDTVMASNSTSTTPSTSTTIPNTSSTQPSTTLSQPAFQPITASPSLRSSTASPVLLPSAMTLTQPPVQPLKSELQKQELSNRTHASNKLRALITPLTSQQLEPLSITMADFSEAIKKVQPSSKREGFATIPDVSWNDIGALEDLRDELSMTILQPIQNPAQFESIGLAIPAGVLLYGPPGKNELKICEFYEVLYSV